MGESFLVLGFGHQFEVIDLETSTSSPPLPCVWSTTSSSWSLPTRVCLSTSRGRPRRIFLSCGPPSPRASASSTPTSSLLPATLSRSAQRSPAASSKPCRSRTAPSTSSAPKTARLPLPSSPLSTQKPTRPHSLPSPRPTTAPSAPASPSSQTRWQTSSPQSPPSPSPLTQTTRLPPPPPSPAPTSHPPPPPPDIPFPLPSLASLFHPTPPPSRLPWQIFRKRQQTHLLRLSSSKTRCLRSTLTGWPLSTSPLPFSTIASANEHRDS